MNFRQLFLFIFLFSVTLAYGQETNSKFLKFANKQDSLFHLAYKRKDVNTYDKLLNEFLSEYGKLSAGDQKRFSNNLKFGYYKLGCIYSLLNNKQMAFKYLNKSIDAGFTRYKEFQFDRDLDNIRKEKEFQSLSNRLRNIGDYIYILKRGEKYNPADQQQIPKFTYQSSDNPNLKILRKAFNLDSIAGTGNDISQILNLMHWIHNLIPHDGNHVNPVVKNAMSMITECKKEHRGLNCRGLATVLNECYLSLGFKSRFITCLPKDSLKIDFDCHVINMVYSNSLKKWLWIDPTNDAYVMNEKGELLSIEEVRERLISDKPLRLNPDANWNHKRIQTKEVYLKIYMAKNLYILECPLSSEYDTETQTSGKVISYVRLLPLDYFNQTPDKSVEEREEPHTTYVIYKTNNQKLFWQTP